jgi:hypothetical protein
VESSTANMHICNSISAELELHLMPCHNTRCWMAVARSWPLVPWLAWAQVLAPSQWFQAGHADTL